MINFDHNLVNLCDYCCTFWRRYKFCLCLWVCDKWCKLYSYNMSVKRTGRVSDYLGFEVHFSCGSTVFDLEITSLY